ncbi:MAG: hypothetical protein A2X08_09905 [Bacteroidetes bacterium GWA2_32_17]|nr:MAG: hypothetical protein A2X08_09905 [Bacteroidetes bacterium GWA2_32_17]
MKNITKIVIAGLFSILCFQVFSQTAAQPRTYQFIFFSEDAKDIYFQEQTILTDSLLIKIEQLRQPTEVVYAKISARTLIKIFPENIVISESANPKKYFIEMDNDKQQGILEQVINLEN